MGRIKVDDSYGIKIKQHLDNTPDYLLAFSNQGTAKVSIPKGIKPEQIEVCQNNFFRFLNLNIVNSGTKWTPNKNGNSASDCFIEIKED